ncbi:MAG: FAD-dependent oxidoreductase [Candidatus Wildermuthbacteria bacterium]|nr:FAD-dependent oxidoreductase [Candidatus Wildermuthbacteria bacterium]
MNFDLIIIGSGAAGLAAAMYAGRYKMKTVILEKEFGGETATAGKIENYPGILSIDGYDLVLRMKEHALHYGAEMQEGKAVKLSRDSNLISVETSKGEKYLGKTLILALGAQRRYLGLEREKELTGKGVHYCWTCDGPLFGGKTVAMVGGGDSSVKGVNFLAEYASKIYLIARGKEVVAEPVNFEQMKGLGRKVEIITENEIKEFVGKDKLEKIILKNPYKGSSELKLDGLFVEIGFDPNTELPSQLGIKLDDKGYIEVDNKMRTNVEGVFAAGDATSHFGSFKQDITAAALGAVAATSAYEYSKSH